MISDRTLTRTQELVPVNDLWKYVYLARRKSTGGARLSIIIYCNIGIARDMYAPHLEVDALDLEATA